MDYMSIKKQMRAHSFSGTLGMRHRLTRFAALATLGMVALAGCGGGSGTATNPITDGPSAGPTYNGPPPATSDIQAFRVAFWENVRAGDRCGSCHNAGGQAPTFARSDDVNQAYQQASGVVNREMPAQSPLVTKVAGGHNCWLPDPGACAAILTRWIGDWVGASGTGGRQIQLEEPPVVTPGGSKRFPAPDDPNVNVPALFGPVYAKLDQWCSGCHQANSATAQTPYFAQGTAPTDANNNSDAFKEAYLASIPKINLENPAASRFVIRLRNEQHNCFNDCAADARELEDLIRAMADQIDTEDTPPGMLSNAVTLYDGTLASGGNRYESALIALYEFKTGQGAVAYDTSGVAPAADLNLSGDVTWVGGYGINIRGGKAQASTTTSRKFHQLITATGEYSLEAWVVPGNVTQEDARIISYSGSTTARNFTLGQNLYNYEFFNRSSETNGNGEIKLATADAAERLQASLQHVVMTFDPVNGRRIYVNGEFTGDMDGAGGGTLDSWDNSFAFVLGNEVSGDRQWQGVVRLVAIHNRALNLQQIQQNFEAGVGQKFFLLFGVSHLIDVPRAYIMFEATQYDSFGYLFTSPKFISLDAQARPGSIPLRSMRIGVNGVEAAVGQAYRPLETVISDDQYSPETGQLLSSIGTIVPLERGPEFDQFFLCFDQLGTALDQCTKYTAGTRQPPVLAAPSSDIGVKLFDAINATMASITGVDPNQADVKRSYNNVRQSLPAVHDVQGYLSSHQTAVAQLALTYCNVMVNNVSLRDAFFGPSVNFSGALTSGASLNANGEALIARLHEKAIGSGTAQPTDAEFNDAVGGLVMTLCSSSACSDTRTADVIKAACGAALGSAATLVQ